MASETLKMRKQIQKLFKPIVHKGSKTQDFLTEFIVLGGRLQFDLDDPA